MTRRLAISVTVSAALAAGLTLPAASQANLRVNLLKEDQDPSHLVTFTTAKCRKAKKKKALLKFHAKAKKGGYRLSVNVFKSGREHNIQYGFGPVDFTVTGPEGSFTNLNRPPNAPPGGGALVFNNRKKTRFGLGFSPAFSDDFGSGISLGGGVKCKYPKKKKPRR